MHLNFKDQMRIASYLRLLLKLSVIDEKQHDAYIWYVVNGKLDQILKELNQDYPHGRTK